MKQSKFFPLKKIHLVIIVLGFSLLLPADSLRNSYAHPFLEYDKPIRVNAEITKVKLNWNGTEYDFIDYGIHAEVMVTYVFLEPNHPNDKMINFLEIEGWNPSYHGWTVPGGKISQINLPEHEKYDHSTCLDLTNMEVVIMVQEIDTDTLSAIGFKILGTEAGKYVLAKYMAKQVGKGNIYKILKPSIPSVVGQIILYWVQENESLGEGGKTEDLSWVDEDFEFEETITTNSTEYGNAEVTYKISGEVDEEGDCSSESSYLQLDENQSYALMDDETRFYDAYDDFIESTSVNISQLSSTTQIRDANGDDKKMVYVPEENIGVLATSMYYTDDLMALLAEDLEGIQEEKYLELFSNARNHLNNDQFFLAFNSYQDAWKYYKESTANNREKSDIPSWIKNNAAWWSQGLIDDKDFALGIGFMIKKGIIKVDNVNISQDDSIEISDDIIIPAWIKNNAKWWGEGKITDVDFKEGIQFMVQEEIVSFQGSQKKQINPPSLSIETRPSMDKETKQKILQYHADALLANNIALKQLLEMQNFVGISLDDFTENTWKNFSENKNPEIMESAIQLEDITRMMKEDSLKTVEVLKNSNENIDLFFKEIKENDFDNFVLKKNAEEKLKDLIEIPKIKSNKDLEVAEKNAQKIDQIIENSVENAKQLGAMHKEEMPEIAYSQSSRYSLEFEPGSIDDVPSTSYGVDSRIFAKTCTTNSECDSSMGESCSSRSSDTSGRCIPTWFGICHAWGPSCLGNIYKAGEDLSSEVSYSNEFLNDEETSQSNDENSLTYDTTVLVLSGAYYPITQFTVWKWIGECDDSWHYHTQSGSALNLKLSGKGDPDPENCGFGKVDEITKKTIQITSEEVNSFLEYSGINPIGNNPIYGGSGP